MTTGLRSLRAQVREAMRPPPSLLVSEWADGNRILSSVESGEPGQWRTSRTPYLREPMDRLSPADPCEEVVAMFGTQTGKTEIGLNWIGAIIDHWPGPMLAVQPTVDMGKRWSKGRLAPMCTATPCLARKVRAPRSRDSGNTVLAKEFPGGILVVAGANSASGLSSMPVKFLFLDEIDRYPHDVDNEGSPSDLAIERTATFRGTRKILKTSTPTVKDHSAIEAAFEETDKRYYFVPCPACDHFQIITWDHIVWAEGDPRSAGFCCGECGVISPEHHKPKMLAAGEWRATAEGKHGKHGYHLSGLYSPWVTWGEIAAKFVVVKKDPFRLKVWVNTKLAETWDESDGDGIDAHDLVSRIEDWGTTAPAEVCLITAAVDVQDDRLEVEIAGWGVGEERWSLDYVVVWGDPSGTQVWEDVDEVLLRRIDHASDGSGMPIHAACIDTGGHHTLAAYKFCKARGKRRVWAIKGKGGEGYNLWPRRPSRQNKGKVNLYTIGVDAGKAQTYARLRVLEPGPGYMHFPMDRGSDYFGQLTCEVRRTRYAKGVPVRYWWKKDGTRNEALDLAVYNLAALHGLYALGKRLQPNLDTEAHRRDPSRKRERRKGWLSRSKGKWL